MFEDSGFDLDSELDEMDIADMSTAQLADCVVVCHRAHQAAGCRMLILAAAWADTHPKRATQLNEAGKPLPGGDRGRIFGAESNLQHRSSARSSSAHFKPQVRPPRHY